MIIPKTEDFLKEWEPQQNSGNVLSDLYILFLSYPVDFNFLVITLLLYKHTRFYWRGSRKSFPICGYSPEGQCSVKKVPTFRPFKFLFLLEVFQKRYTRIKLSISFKLKQ